VSDHGHVCVLRSLPTASRHNASATGCRARARSRRATEHFRSISDRPSGPPSSPDIPSPYTSTIGPGRQTAESCRFLRSRSASDHLLHRRTVPVAGPSPNSRARASPVERTNSSRRGTRRVVQCSDLDRVSRSPTGRARPGMFRRSAVVVVARGRSRRGRRWIASKRCWPISRCATTT